MNNILENWEAAFRKRFVKGIPPLSNTHNDMSEAESWVEADPEELEGFIFLLLQAQREQQAQLTRRETLEECSSKIKSICRELKDGEIKTFLGDLSDLFTSLNFENIHDDK